MAGRRRQLSGPWIPLKTKALTLREARVTGTRPGSHLNGIIGIIGPVQGGCGARPGAGRPGGGTR